MLEKGVVEENLDVRESAPESLAEYWNKKSGLILYDETKSRRVVQVSITLGTKKRLSWPADMVYPITERGYQLAEKLTETNDAAFIASQPSSSLAINKSPQACFRRRWLPWYKNIEVSIRRAFIARNGGK